MKVITIGKRLVPGDQVAFVESFDPAANPEFKVKKDFKARVVLLNRDMILTDQNPQEFTGRSSSGSRSLSQRRASSRRSPIRPDSNGGIKRARSRASFL